MTTPAEAAKHAAELGINHILDEQIRIARQKELIVKLERENDGAAVNRAKETLKQMEEFLAQMTADHAAAEERLAQATTDASNRDRGINVTWGGAALKPTHCCALTEQWPGFALKLPKAQANSGARASAGFAKAPPGPLASAVDNGLLKAEACGVLNPLSLRRLQTNGAPFCLLRSGSLAKLTAAVAPNPHLIPSRRQVRAGRDR